MGEALPVDHVQEKPDGLAFVSIDYGYFLFPYLCYVHKIIRIEGAMQSHGIVCVTTKDSRVKLDIIHSIDPKTS